VQGSDHNIIVLRDKFVFREHQCLVFDLLSINLYDVLKSTKFHGVSLHTIRKFAKQLVEALAFLARPDIDIIHCGKVLC